MAQMSNRDKPSYYNITIYNGTKVIAYNVPKSKVQKVIKDLSLTYNQKMEAQLVEEA